MRGANPVRSPPNRRHVPAYHPCVAGERFVCLIDGISPNDKRVSANPGLRVNNGVASDNGRMAVDATRDVEISEKDEDAAGQITFNLHRAEDAGGIVNLPALSDEDVLVEVGAGTGTLRRRGCRRQHK